MKRDAVQSHPAGPGIAVHSATGPARGAAVRVIRGLIVAYQWLFSSWLPPTCRFVPSCSDYALRAVQLHGPIRGLGLAVRRLARCHPWGGSGIDDVPPVCEHESTTQSD